MIQISNRAIVVIVAIIALAFLGSLSVQNRRDQTIVESLMHKCTGGYHQKYEACTKIVQDMCTSIPKLCEIRPKGDEKQ